MSKPTRTDRAVAALRHDDATVRAVVAEGFFNRFGFGIVTFALPLYALHLGLGIAEVGLVIAAKALVQPFAKPLMGVLVDRVGSRRGYLVATTFRLASALALLAATTPAALLGVRLLQGAASAAQEPAAITTLARGDGSRLGRRFSAVMAARDLGKVSAGVVGGLLLGLTGSFTLLWVVVAAVAAAPVLIVWRWVHDEPGTSAPQPASATAKAPRELTSLLRSRRLRLIALLGVFGGMTAHMTSGLFQVYASEVAGLDPAQIGFVYSGSLVALLAVGPVAGWAADRFGNGLLASSRAVANGASSVVYLLFPSFAGMLGGRLVDDAGKAAFRPTWGALVASAARDAGRRRGRVAANLDAALSFGEAIGPLVAALVWDLWGAVAFLGLRAVLGIGVEVVLGRRLRAALRAEAQPPPAVELLPGPGRLALRGVDADGFAAPLSLTVEPRTVAAVLTGEPRYARAVVEVLTGARAASSGTVELDGQLLADCAPASVRRAVAPLDLTQPPAGTAVRDWLARHDPAAPPERLVRVWYAAGLAETVGDLWDADERRVESLAPLDRARLSLASSLLADPAVLVLDEHRGDVPEGLAATLDRVLTGHRGAVVLVDPPPERLHLADVVVDAGGRVEPRSRTLAPAAGGK